MNSKNTFAFWLILLFSALAAVQSQAQTGWYRVHRDALPPSVDFLPVGLFEMPDGGFMVPVHRFNHAFPVNTIKYNHITLRTDAAGRKQWMRYDSIPENAAVGFSRPTDAIFKREVGIFESWAYKPNATGDVSIGLARYNSNSTLHSFHTIEGQNGQQSTISIAETSDGYIAGCGYSFFPSPQYANIPFIEKHDFEGAPVWFKAVNSLGIGGVSKVLPAAGGALYVCGYTADTVNNVPNPSSLAKFDADGNLLWHVPYPEAGTTYAVDFAATPAGDLYLITNKQGLIHVSGNGDFQAFTQIVLNPFYNFFSTQALSFGADGNLYFTGIASDPLNDQYGYIAKISPDGALLWDHYFAGVTTLPELIRTKDGNMAAAGQYLAYQNSSSPPPNGIFVVKIHPDGTTFGSGIEGSIYGETDNDCTHSPEDFRFPGALIRIDGADATYATLTDEDGHYETPLDTGAYQFSIISPSPYWGAPCNDPGPVSVPDLDGTVTNDFQYTQAIDCPYMTVDISTIVLRPCMNSTYDVAWQNLGTTTAAGAFIDLTFDAGLIVIGASIPYTQEPGDIYRFQLGDVAPLQNGEFQVTVAVDCNTELGQTLCAVAHAYPDTLCQPPNPLWSGASLEVKATCEGDSVRFTVKNKGTGNMTTEQEFIVIEDTAILMTEPFQLLVDSEFVKTVAVNNGAYLRGETAQVPNHPGFSHPAAWVEGCNGFNGTGYVNQFPLDDADNFIERDCHEVVGSFDPNDKTGFPTGIGADRLLAKNTDLEYLIRFQNTGTDTAFTVLVRDTLPAGLDWTSVQPGASSHPYKFNISGPGVIGFRFDNILLPDSNANEAASHGYLKFRIRQKPNLADGTLLLNSAAIYFDFNEPVITNTTLHRIGELEAPVIVGATEPAQPLLRISPNPMEDASVLQLDKIPAGSSSTFILYDVNGWVLRRTTFNGNTLVIRREGLIAGVYGFRVEQAGRALGTGKLLMR